MDYLPINISVKGLKILIVGGGNVALQKIRTLVKHSCNIEVIAPDIKEEINAFDLNIKIREFEDIDLSGAYLVYAATNNKVLNEHIANKCKKNSILVNVVDNPALSDFTSLATLYHGKHTISIGSDAKSPGESVKLRIKITKFLNGKQID